MEPQLRELLDHSTFCVASIQAVIPLLPASNEELDVLVEELIAAADPIGLLFVLLAATAVERQVDAKCLLMGTAILNQPVWIVRVSWGMVGEVPEALLKGVQSVATRRETHAAVLFIIASYCQEKREGVLPPEFLAEAKKLARVKDHTVMSKGYLGATAFLIKDEVLLQVLRYHHPDIFDPNLEKGIVACGMLLMFQKDSPVLDLVPLEETKNLSLGKTLRRSVEKMGRNDPCHCGSGQKYKRCCADKDAERMKFSTDVAGKTYAELRTNPEAGLTLDRLQKMHSFQTAQLDPLKIPAPLTQEYFFKLCAFGLCEQVASYFEVMPWDAERQYCWRGAIYFVEKWQRKDIAQRLMAIHAKYESTIEVREGVLLVLAKDDPVEELRVLDLMAGEMLRYNTEAEPLIGLSHGYLNSRHKRLAILICRGVIPLLPTKDANALLEEIMAERDKLNLPPSDPFSDILEKRIADETHDEGKDATELRAARKRLEAKAAEVRHLQEEIERQRRALKLKEKQKTLPAAVQPVSKPADDPEMKEMRRKLTEFKGLLNERSAERITLRRELEKTREDLETLRNGQAPANGGTEVEDENIHYLPVQPAGNQPLRLVEFPPHFLEILEDFPRQVARAALAMIGRLAGGEPAAFAGVVQLKAVHGVHRQRIGIEHRLLFRLQPDRLIVVDFINRRDLDRRIKSLRATG